MNEPLGIVPTAVYDSEQACAVLRIGESKLQELVSGQLLMTLDFTSRRRFWGEELIRFCRESSALPERGLP